MAVSEEVRVDGVVGEGVRVGAGVGVGEGVGVGKAVKGKGE